jgi:hypothetical protein
MQLFSFHSIQSCTLILFSISLSCLKRNKQAIVLQPSIAKIPLDENQVDTIFASKDKALGKSEKYRDREIKIIRLEVLCCFLYL